MMSVLCEVMAAARMQFSVEYTVIRHGLGTHADLS